MPEGVGIPTARGMMSSVGDFAYGAGGQLVYNIVTRFTGSGLLGGVAGAAVAGSVVKGTRGEVIATVMGMQAAGSDEVQGLLSNIPFLGEG